MTAKYFLISEVGDRGLWLVDTGTLSVARIEEDVLQSGPILPDGDLLSDIIGLKDNHGYTLIKGISLAVATDSAPGAIAHDRAEAEAHDRVEAEAHDRVEVAAHDRVEGEG